MSESETIEGLKAQVSKLESKLDRARMRLQGILERVNAALAIEADAKPRAMTMPALTALSRIRDLLVESRELANEGTVFVGVDWALTQLDIVFEDRSLPIVGGDTCPPDLVFVECEVDGENVRAGEWIDMNDGTRALRLRVVEGEVRK